MHSSEINVFIKDAFEKLVNLLPVIQGLRAGCCDFLARRLVRPVRGGSPEDEQRPPHHVAGGSEWMVSRTTATRGGY